MEDEIRSIVDAVCTLAPSVTEKRLQVLRETVVSKTDVFRTLAEAPQEGNTTRLLQYTREFQYPASVFAGILFLWNQAKYLPDHQGVQATFFEELSRLIFAAKAAADEVAAAETAVAAKKERSAAKDAAVAKASTDDDDDYADDMVAGETVPDSHGGCHGIASKTDKRRKGGSSSSSSGSSGGSSSSKSIDTFQFLGKEVAAVLQRAVSVATKDALNAMQAITLMQAASDLLRPREGCLTAADCLTLQSCLKAQYYSYAEKLLEGTFICEIDPSSSFLDTEHFLKYFYYGGLVYMARHRYQKALECFEQCITIPSDACSAISLEAYKKAVLVSLLHTGAAYTVPKYSSPVVRRRCTGMKEYHQIQEHFAACNKGKMAALLADAKVRSALIADGNIGLAQSVFASVQSQAMKNLTSTYIKLSLEDIAQKIGAAGEGGAGADGAASVQQVEAELAELIAKGVIQGTIDQSSGIVSFGGSSNGVGGNGSGADLDGLMSAIEEATSLSEKLREMKKSVLTSMEYVKSKSSSSKMGGGLMSDSLGGYGGLGDHDDEDMEMD
jgi:COP9 signalosome complex subunit 3